ncbi:MAG: Nif3-like dinuclear metal center hexameric protein [Spirochaetota bacterium]
MNIHEAEEFLTGLFEPMPDEMGLTAAHAQTIHAVGYATNLTPEVIDAAAERNVDLILTHHNAWNFIYGMDVRCRSLLREHRLSHFFVHLPLDAADFGTSATFVERLGASIVGKTTAYKGLSCGRIAEFSEPLPFEDLVAKVSAICEEKVLSWKNHTRSVRRIGFVAGAGEMTADMLEMVEKGCDAYITGEKVLYTLQYASFKCIDLIVGSHTYTELPGVERLARRLIDQFPELSLMRLPEAHDELPQ